MEHYDANSSSSKRHHRDQQFHVEPKTQVIELCNHFEYYSDNMDAQVGDNGESGENKPYHFEIPEEETQNGYASGPEHLEHSSILPIVVENKTQEPMIIGKKRQRRRKEKKNKGDNVDGVSAGVSSRKKKVITNCEHVDREFYARGMCKNCYHKKGRTKKAECCPDRMLYSKNLC